MPGVGGDALSYGTGVHSACPSLSITSAFVSQPPGKITEALKGLEDTSLSDCCGSQAGKLRKSLWHSREK